MKAAAIILSGGKSSRMGTNKALLKIREKTNMERITGRLQPIVDEIILVTNEPETYASSGLNITTDYFPGMGPLAGIHAGLLASRYETNFIVACDMPFVSGEMAEALVKMSGEYDAVVPVIHGRQHPLCSIFKKKAVKEIEQSLTEQSLKVTHLLERLSVLYVTEKEMQADPAVNLEHVFFNMNSPNDYEKAKKWAEEEDDSSL